MAKQKVVEEKLDPIVTKKKTTGSFKLPKCVKMEMSNFLDPTARGNYKRMMINALITQQENQKRISVPKDIGDIA